MTWLRAGVRRIGSFLAPDMVSPGGHDALYLSELSEP
jgi:hypothetical protein